MPATEPGTTRPNAHPKDTMASTLERPSVVPGSAPSGSAAPSPAPIAAVPARAPAPPRPNRVPTLVLGTLALVGIVFGVLRWRWGLTHVSTDDAQLEGHVIPTLARVAGYVQDVPVIENQHMRAGDLLVRLDDREFTARLAQADADYQAALAVGGDGRAVRPHGAGRGADRRRARRGGAGRGGRDPREPGGGAPAAARRARHRQPV